MKKQIRDKLLNDSSWLHPATRVALLKKEDDAKATCTPFDFETEAICLNSFDLNAGYATNDYTADIAARYMQ